MVTYVEGVNKFYYVNTFWFYKICHHCNVNWAIYCRTSLSRWTAATVACLPASFRSTWAGMSHTVWQENETLTLKVKMTCSLKPPLKMFRWHPSITVSQKYRNYACSLHSLKIPFFPGESGFLSLRQTCLSSGSILQTCIKHYFCILSLLSRRRMIFEIVKNNLLHP